MITYLKKKIEKKKLKRTFNEYGYKIKEFNIESLGQVEYAQWVHPFEQPKEITEEGIQFYRQLCDKGSFIVDIGAHTGDTTVPMALAVGEKGKVVGLEPNKYVFKILEKNAALNKGLANIEPLCFAATSEEGKFIFNYSDASFCNGGFLSKIQSNRHKHNYILEVEGKNLQDYLLNNYKDELNNLSLIKVDAEGYDKEILKTIPKILDDCKPALMIECYKRLTKEERLDLFNVVKKHGYSLYYLSNFEQFDTLKEIHAENMMDQKHFEMLALHDSKKMDYQIKFK